MSAHIIKDEMNQYANEQLYPEEWQLDGLIEDAEKIYAPAGRLKKEELVELSRDELKEELKNTGESEYIREQARKQLRLLNPGEILFTFEDDE